MKQLGASLLVLVCLSGCNAAADDTAGIQVLGRGMVEVAPDMGYVDLYVRREGPSADALKQELDTVVRAVLELTRQLAIAERDVTATAISITPRYRRRDKETVVEGLVATRTISITLRELDRFGELLNRALSLGVNNVNPMRLDTSRRSELEDEALDLAMSDARREAARVAAGFEVTLGQVTRVQVSSHTPQPRELARAAVMSDAGTDISVGVIRIERSLQATFAIGRGD